MSNEKQSKANGLWVKLVTLLLVILGYFARDEFETLKAAQATTEAKVVDIDKKLDVLSAKVGMGMAQAPSSKTTASNEP